MKYPHSRFNQTLVTDVASSPHEYLIGYALRTAWPFCLKTFFLIYVLVDVSYRKVIPDLKILTSVSISVSYKKLLIKVCINVVTVNGLYQPKTSFYFCIVYRNVRI